MLVKRVVTGIVGMLVTVYVVMYGGWLFSAVVALLGVLAWLEFCKAFRGAGLALWEGAGVLAVFLLTGCAWLGNDHEMVMVLMLLLLAVFSKAVFFYHRFSIVDAAITVSGILYIGLAFAHLILLRFSGGELSFATALGFFSPGSALLWMAFAGTWASDIFAFFVGSYLGRHKLCPAISPGKTVEGALGGVAGSVLALILLGTVFRIAPVHAAILGVLVGCAAPVGDLAESALKRYTGIKDSGRLLPGHGGILDRFDSVLFTVPVVYYYTQIFPLY